MSDEVINLKFIYNDVILFVDKGKIVNKIKVNNVIFDRNEYNTLETKLLGY